MKAIPEPVLNSERFTGLSPLGVYLLARLIILAPALKEHGFVHITDEVPYSSRQLATICKISEQELLLGLENLRETDFLNFDFDETDLFINLHNPGQYIVEEKRERGKKEKKQEIREWAMDFAVYHRQALQSMEKLLADDFWISERQKYHPGMDIKASVTKAFKDFWLTQAGWAHKKKAKSTDLDWKSTANKALSMPMNKVYLPRASEDTKRNFSAPNQSRQADAYQDEALRAFKEKEKERKYSCPS